MSSVNIYLNFNGNAEEAFNFYRSVLGGEFASFQRFKDVPGEAPPPGDAEKLMHVSLPVGSNMIMASDMPEKFGKAVIGNNFSVSLNADSKQDADRMFSGLSNGGNVTLPMEHTFWGSYFGMFIDRFGINWMISFDEKK